jgi:hypothetical protein
MNPNALPNTTFWARFLRGGVSLAPFERFLLTTLEQHVPEEMAIALRHQWRELNLIQRSPDWQELRFYPLVAGRVNPAHLPKLPVRDGEVKLLGVTARRPGTEDVVNVNCWAVDGRFFSLNADRPLRPFRELDAPVVEVVEHSYRSNLMRRGA